MGLLNIVNKVYRIASDTLDQVLAGIETSALEQAVRAYDETRPLRRITGPIVVAPTPTSSETPSLEKLAIYGWDEENLTDWEARSIIIKAVPGHSHETLACETREQLIKRIESLIHCWLCNRIPELGVKQIRPEPQEQQITLFKLNENNNFLPREYFSPYHPQLGDKAVQVKTIGAGGFGIVYQMRSQTGKRSADDHTICLIFARKVLRQNGSVGDEDIKNEIRALDKLCRADRGEFLVQVFHHRPADDTSPSIGVYQIDISEI